MKRKIINLNCFSEKYLFHIIKSESELKNKITDHAKTINPSEGVHLGRLIVLYHTNPLSAKYEDAEPVMITKRGIIK